VKNRYGWKKMAQIATIVTEASARLYNQKGQDAGTGLGLARFDRAFDGSPLAGAVHDENPFFKENRGRGPLFLGEERALFSRVRDQGLRRKDKTMAKEFDPAPRDKHADSEKQGIKKDKRHDDELEKGLKDTFPASDPVSSTQPSKATPDARRRMKWD
jgi:hypothetical protein